MTTYSDAELLEQYRSALFKIASGQSYTINGRSLTNADLKMVRDTIDWLEQRISDSSGDANGGLALVQYGERV